MRVLLWITGLLLSGAALFAAPMPENPLTAEQASQVISRLDLTRPGLEKIADAVARKDGAAARKETAAYFRKKAAGTKLTPRKLRLDRADRTVQGYMKEVHIPHRFPDGIVHWGFNPTQSQGRSFDPEWLWQLNRMSFWHDLAYAYHATRDEKYARTFAAHLRSWAAYWKKPKGGGGGHHSAWRTIECGIRMAGSWPYAFTAFAPSGTLTDEDILLYFHCSLLQADHLQKYPKTGNWLTMEMNGLYTFAAAHPEFRQSAGWRKFAMDRLYHDLQKQILPDGAQYELSPGYHAVALSNSFSLLRRAEAAGYGQEIPAPFRELLRRGYRYSAQLMTPDRSFPKINDSWQGNITRQFWKLDKLFPDDLLIAFGAKGAKVEDAPSFTSCFFPYAGFAVFRQNWRRDSHYLLFDAGPLGRAHAHQDKLNIILFGYGEELLFDDGGGNYEHSVFRRYALSSAGHSLVLVDGLGQDRKNTGENRVASSPIDAGFTTGPEADYAESSISEFAGKANGTLHRRQVWYIKPDLFLICDRLTPQDRAIHHYQARWQVDTLKMLPQKGGYGILQSDRGKKADIVITPLATEGLQVRHVSNVTEGPDMGGLYVGRVPRPFRPAVTVLHERSGAGEQIFLTLLCPVRSGEKPLIRQIKSSGPRRKEVIFNDDRILQITLPEDGKRPPVWHLTRKEISR